MLKVYENCKFEKSSIRLSDLAGNRAIICESGLMLTELAYQGTGVAIRSIWDVQPLFDSGKLVPVLSNHRLSAFGNMYAVVPTRRLISHRVKVFLDFLTTKAKPSSVNR